MVFLSLLVWCPVFRKVYSYRLFGYARSPLTILPCHLLAVPSLSLKCRNSKIDWRATTEAYETKRLFIEPRVWRGRCRRRALSCALRYRPVTIRQKSRPDTGRSPPQYPSAVPKLARLTTTSRKPVSLDDSVGGRPMRPSKLQCWTREREHPPRISSFSTSQKLKFMG